MKNFEHIIDHYKDHIRLDNETAWNIICRFKDIVENKNDKDNEMFWCIMKDIHEELRGKHFDEQKGHDRSRNISTGKQPAAQTSHKIQKAGGSQNTDRDHQSDHRGCD